MSVDTPTQLTFQEKEDIFWILRRFYLDPYQNVYVQAFSWLMFLALAVLTLFQTGLYLLRFNAVYFIKYLPIYGSFLFILAAVGLSSKVSFIYIETLKSWMYWDDTQATSLTRRRIKKEALYFQVYTVINTILALLCGILYVVPLDHDEDILFPLAIFEEFLPQHRLFLEWSFRACFIPISLMMPAIFYMTIYVVLRLRADCILMIDFCKSIGEDLQNKDEKTLFYDEEYQEEVRKGLAICIERHSSFCRLNSKLLDNASPLIAIFSIAGAVLGICVLVFYFSFQGSMEGRYPRIGSLALTAVLTFIHVILAGQMVENTSNKFEETLCNVNWYDWNQKNKLSFLIFLLNVQKTVQVKFSDSTCVNYELGVEISKTIYSMISVISQLDRLDYSKN